MLECWSVDVRMLEIRLKTFVVNSFESCFEAWAVLFTSVSSIQL